MKRFRLRRQIFLIVIALIGVSISLVLGKMFSERENRLVEMKFDADVHDRVLAFRSALSDRLSIVRFVSAFFAASRDVERSEFFSFTKPLLADNPDLAFIAWVPQVPSRLRARFEEELQLDGLGTHPLTCFQGKGKLQPVEKRTEHYPFMFVEPDASYQHLIGFDLAVDPVTRAAIDRAMKTKQPIIARCPLPDAKGNVVQTLCLFEYAEVEPSNSPMDPPSQFHSGVIVSEVRLETLMNDSLKNLPEAGVSMYLFEDSPEGATILSLVQPSRLHQGKLPHLEKVPAATPGMASLTHLRVADRSWTIYCEPIDSYLTNQRGWTPWVAFLLGCFITGTSVGYLYLLTGRTERVEFLVEQRTEALRISEQRFRRLADNAGDSFFLLDSAGRIVDVNRRACERLGYAREELLSMNVWDIDARSVQTGEHRLPWDLSTEGPKTFEGEYRQKNGESFPVEVRLSFLDYAGQRWYLALARDITERKRAEMALREEQSLLRRLLELMEQDRKLVAYEIHDGLAQQLTGLVFQLQSMKAMCEAKNIESALGILPNALDLASQSIIEARRLIGGLRPPVLDESGIVAAIGYLVEEKQRTESIAIHYSHDVLFRHLAKPLEAALFRIAQESLTNACRYSQSEKIEVELKQTENSVRLRVQDWGIGIGSKPTRGQHFGIRGIRERARLLGGSAEIDSQPGQGTTVFVEFPLVENHAEEEDEFDNAS